MLNINTIDVACIHSLAVFLILQLIFEPPVFAFCTFTISQFTKNDGEIIERWGSISHPQIPQSPTYHSIICILPIYGPTTTKYCIINLPPHHPITTHYPNLQHY